MSRPPHIIVVDDDAELRGLIADFLAAHGFRATPVSGGAELDLVFARDPADLVVLDLMMPGEDGLSILRRLRREAALPVIMLSAMNEDTDRIIGLEVGADDYVAKPCNPRELLARIRAVLRRGAEPRPQGETRRVGPVIIDLVHRRLETSGGSAIGLSDAEFRVLVALMERPLQTVGRDALIEATRGIDSEVFDRSIDVTISRLRRKLASPGLIRTIRNEGYMLTQAPAL